MRRWIRVFATKLSSISGTNSGSGWGLRPIQSCSFDQTIISPPSFRPVVLSLTSTEGSRAKQRPAQGRSLNNAARVVRQGANRSARFAPFLRELVQQGQREY